MGKLGLQFSKLTLPSTIYTREVGFVIGVDEDVEWIGTSSMPILGTTYSASAIQPKVQEAAYGSYICTAVNSSGGRWYFYFSKNKTTAEALVPYKDPAERFGNHYWPPILKRVDFKKSKMPATVNTGDGVRRAVKYYDEVTYIPSADTGSLFLTREFISPTEFHIPQWPTPLAGSVSWSFPTQGSFQECLHDDIEIQNLKESDSTYSASGAQVTSDVGLISGVSFPATNFKTWLPHILSDSQSKTAVGSWHRTQIEVVPPPLPKAQRK